MNNTVFSDDDLHAICLGAESLLERNSLGAVTSENIESIGLEIFRRERWVASAAAGDRDLFATLLELQGLDFASCGRYLRPGQKRMAGDKCPWLPRLRLSLAQMQDRVSCEAPPLAISKKYPLPFEDIFFAVITGAEEERDFLVRSSCGGELDDFVPGLSRSAMQRTLLVRLCGLSAEVFFRHFDHLRSSSRRNAEVPLPQVHAGQQLYMRLVHDHRDGLLRESFLMFPVLARLICLAIDQWIETTAEMLRRLWVDLPLLHRHFGVPVTSRVESIVALGSDPHLGGRSTWVVKFLNSCQIVYKPRSLALDGAWMSWLRWLDEHGAPPSAGRLAVFDAGTHGWMEWAEHGPGEVAAEDYFQRFGAMLCLAHLFNANDLHYENVVVAGSIPHIVDLETLFHPRNGLRSEEDRFDEVERAARGSLRDTVAWTKLLPAWLTTYDVDAFAIGALNPKEVSSRKEYRFVETNTDLMQVVRVDIEAAESKSLPQSLSGTQWASHGAPLLCEGFERMWQFVANHRRAILKRRGPLEAFRNAHVRVLLKSTQLYFFALKRSLAADFLVDGGVWSSQQQVLCRFLGSPEMALRWFDVFRAEERALARLDVPYFSVRCDGTTLLADGEPLLKDAFAISPFRSVRQHLLQMSTEEMKRQTFLISQSVLALEEPILVQTPSEELTAECATRQDLIAEAQTIGNLLLRSSVEGKGHHWISLAPLVRSRYRQIEAMGIDLYSGNSGIALFFAALGSATKDESWGKAARAALVPVLASIRDRITASKLARAVGLGAATGLGSIAYSLARIGRFLQSEEFCEASLQICKHVTSDLIQFDQDLDALSGTAGGILGLLTVASETAQDWPIEIAIACGDHLLAFAQSGPDGTAFWRGRSGEIEAGMAHGAAGICLALHRLGEVAGSSKYTSTALSGLEFERRSDARGDYFSTLPVGLDRAMKEALACRWCRGSAGLGLALVGTVGGAQLEQRSQIRALTEKIRAHTLAAEDNLCCGNFGRVEFLLAAGLQLHDEDLILQARLVASRLLRRRRLSGSFAARVHDEVNPGFFTGISGIGYGLLRSIEPDSFPSVLLWE